MLTLGAPQTAPASASVGLATGNWCPPPPDSGLFADQRIDEARSACFETEPLADPVAVLGAPRVRFADRPPRPARDRVGQAERRRARRASRSR